MVVEHKEGSASVLFPNCLISAPTWKRIVSWLKEFETLRQNTHVIA